MIATDYIYGKKTSVLSQESNLFIGGVASEIISAAALASKLRTYPDHGVFSAADIQNFKTVGNDIECYIGVQYQLTGNHFTNNLNITYFKEFGGFCKHWESLYFAGAENIEVIETPSAVKVTKGSASLQRNNKLKTIDISNAGDLGGTPSDDGIFTAYSGAVPFQSGCRIYAHPTMATINNGGKDGDLIKAESFNAVVYFVENSIKPNPLTDATVRSYATAMQLIDDGSSENSIDYFTNIKINGVSHPDILANNWISGLIPSTQYTIEATVVDIYYNKRKSAAITKITSATEIDAIPYVSRSNISGDPLITQINDTIGVFKSSGIWDRAVGIYPFIGNKAEKVKFNLKDPRDSDAAKRLVVNGGTIGENTWFTNNGIGSHLETFITPAELGLNNYHLSFYSLNQHTSNSTLIRAMDASNNLVRSLTLNNTIYNDGYSAAGGGRLTSAIPNTIGLITVQRDDANVQKNYKNGVLVGSDSNGVTGTMPDVTFKIYGVYLMGCFFVISKSLTDSQNATLHAEIVKINQILGR